MNNKRNSNSSLSARDVRNSLLRVSRGLSLASLLSLASAVGISIYMDVKINKKEDEERRSKWI